MNDDRWIENRLAALKTPPDWHPNAAQGMGKLQKRKRAARSFRIRLMWASATAGVLIAGVLWMPVSGSCAPPPSRCEQRLWQRVFLPQPAVKVVPVSEPTPVEPPPIVAPLPKAAPRPVKVKRIAPVAPVKNYKETGVASAQIICEIYTDYQCPGCAIFYRDTVPPLVAQYVDTGKVKLRHRDFPLLAHAHARLAARWANAAGRLGYYDTVVNQIFVTQTQWTSNGDVAAVVAQVLPPEAMQKARDLVEHDATLDETVEADVAAGREDQLRQTPSLVIVSKGKRQLLPGTPSFILLKTYLDQVLAGQQ